MFNSKSAINVIVADDHPVVVLGISKMVAGVGDLNLVATATNISGLFQHLHTSECDVLICDYSFEDDDEPDGMLLLERICRLYPLLNIILLTSHDDLMIVQRAMQLGVAGFLSKVSEELSILPDIIRRVHKGERYLDANTSKLMIDNMIANQTSRHARVSTELTSRELEVLRLFCRGMSVTEISHYTSRSVKTISTQKKRAMLKLGANNDIELVNVFSKLY